MKSHQQTDTGSLKKSTISYGIRQVFSTVLGLTSNIILTRLLLPQEYGLIAVIIFVMALITVLADGGLGVYLIQKKADISDDDISDIVNIQLAMSILLIIVLSVIVIINYNFFKYNQIYLLISCTCLTIPLTIIRGMTLIKLERNVQMTKISIVDIFEQTVNASVSVVLAYLGAGVWSIVGGMAAKAVVGCVTSIYIAPWSYKLKLPTLSKEFITGIKFALHYQGAQLINIGRTAVNPLFINSMLGFSNGGYVERANFINSAPVGLISAIQNKVFFPFSSRIQEDRGRLKRFLEDSIYANSVVDKLFYLPLFIFTDQIVECFLTSKWLPIVPLLRWLLSGTMVFGALSGPLYPVINAIGASKVIFKFNLYTMIISWILIVPLTLVFGIKGIGIAGFILWFGVFWLIRELKRHLGAFNYMNSILKPSIISVVIITSSLITQNIFGKVSSNIVPVVLWSFIIILAYLLLLLLVDWKKIHVVISKLLRV